VTTMIACSPTVPASVLYCPLGKQVPPACQDCTSNGPHCISDVELLAAPPVVEPSSGLELLCKDSSFVWLTNRPQPPGPSEAVLVQP